MLYVHVAYILSLEFTNTYPLRGGPILTKGGPQNVITLGPQGAPYLYDFGAPGPQNLKILRPWAWGRNSLIVAM